ncbi:MAG: RNA polymerase sigma-70 factor (ECF subfamily) [Hyphomicrobiaceae bacterium]|jgi:RNA polymerase sigma-70 factor (ECF subfamily)
MSESSPKKLPEVLPQNRRNEHLTAAPLPGSKEQTMDASLGKQPRPAAVTDQERIWLARCREGDNAAFQSLLRPHLTALLSLARRYCRDPHWAEDLVQETLVRAFKGLPNFRAESALRTWLFRILVRLACEPARWQRSMPAESLGDMDVPDHYDGNNAEQVAIARELQDRLDEAMERLTHRQRTALHLRAVEGMDYATISGVLNCSATAARMHVLEARRKVLARVKEHIDS